MALYAVSRDLDPSLGPEEREALGARSVMGASFFPAVQWQRSYVIDQPGRWATLCIYEAPAAFDVAEVSRCFVVPYSKIREVSERVSTTGEPAVAGTRLYLVSATTDSEPTQGPPRDPSPSLRLAAIPAGQTTCIRSYAGALTRESWHVLAASSRDAVEQFVRAAGLACDTIDEVIEDLQANWAHIYDGLGAPRHWE